jgi:hypothetical protein
MMRMGPPEELDMFIYVPCLLGMAELFEMPWLGFLHVLVVLVFHILWVGKDLLFIFGENALYSLRFDFFFF